MGDSRRIIRVSAALRRRYCPKVIGISVSEGNSLRNQTVPRRPQPEVETKIKTEVGDRCTV